MAIPRDTLSNLYLKQHLSMAEIASLLTCSVHKVTYWMTKYHITKRNHSEASYHKHNPNGDPFSIKTSLSSSDLALKHLTLGLYWGEGNKVKRTELRLGNSDPVMLLVWLKFLYNICGVPRNKVHFNLQVFKDNDVTLAKQFWAKQLNISTNQINSGKPTKPLGHGSYRKINTHGVMTVCVYNLKLRNWLFDELKKIGYNPEKR